MCSLVFPLSLADHLSPEEIGKLATRTMHKSKKMGVEMYLWLTASVGSYDAFVTVLQRHPRLAVQIVDAIVKPLTPRLRERIGNVLLEQYGPGSDGYVMMDNMMANIVMRVERTDNGALDNAYSLPFAVVPELRVQLKQSSRGREDMKRRDAMRAEVIGFDAGVLYGVGIGFALGLGWWFFIFCSIYGLSRALAHATRPEERLSAWRHWWVEMVGVGGIVLLIPTSLVLFIFSFFRTWLAGGVRWWVYAFTMRALCGYWVGFLVAIPIQPPPPDLPAALPSGASAASPSPASASASKNRFAKSINKAPEAASSAPASSTDEKSAAAKPAKAAGFLENLSGFVRAAHPANIYESAQSQFKKAIYGADIDVQRMQKMKSLETFASQEGIVVLDLDLDMELKLSNVEFVVVFGKKANPKLKGMSKLASAVLDKLPPFASIRMHHFHFRAACRIWWHVRKKQIRVAFVDYKAREAAEKAREEVEPLDVHVEWDIDLVTCGVAWPDVLEDKLPAMLMRYLLQDYDEGNAFNFDLGEVEDSAKEEECAIKLQASVRGMLSRQGEARRRRQSQLEGESVRKSTATDDYDHGEESVQPSSTAKPRLSAQTAREVATGVRSKPLTAETGPISGAKAKKVALTETIKYE